MIPARTVKQNFFSRLWQCLGGVYTGPTPVLASGPAAHAWAVASRAPGRRECVQLLHQRLQTLVQCRRTRVEVPRVGTDPSGQFGPLSDRHTRIPPSDYGMFTCRNTMCDTAKGRIDKWKLKGLKSSSFISIHAGSSANPVYRLSKIMLPCILTTTDRGGVRSYICYVDVRNCWRSNSRTPLGSVGVYECMVERLLSL